MRRIAVIASVLFVLLTSAWAYADTTYNVQGTLQDGVGQFQGTILYSSSSHTFGNQVTGTLTDGAFTYVVPAAYTSDTVTGPAVEHIDLDTVNPTFELSLFIPVSLLTGNAGGALCALSTPCAIPVTSSFADYSSNGSPTLGLQQFQTLTATPQATPEPGSFVLLGTGLVGMAEGLRRRFRLTRA